MENRRGKKVNRKEKPNKKWTKQEIAKILLFIQEERDFEKPTAQFYYKKCINKMGIDATWDLVRWKVRHLKILHKKAEEWRDSMDAELLESEEGIISVKNRLKKKCPFYDELHEIFGEKTLGESFVICNPAPTPLSLVDNSTLFNPSGVDKFSLKSIEDDQKIDDIGTFEYERKSSSIIQSTVENPTTSSSSLGKKKSRVKQFAEKLEKEVLKTAIDQLAIRQCQRYEVQKIKVELEREKFLKEMEFEERRLQLEEIKARENINRKKDKIELKRLEIEKNERLKILEIEKQERIQMYEIEMKYKFSK